MRPSRRVAIVQRRLTHYRVPLFERLRLDLEERGVELSLLVGEARPGERAKHDSGEISWAVPVPTRYFLGERLCWQPVSRWLDGVDLLVVTQENSLLANHLILIGPRRFKFAFWGHGANLQGANPTGARERFKRWTTRRADWWFAYTRTSAQLVQATGFPADRITVLNNAVDTAQLRRQLDSITPEESAALRDALGLGQGPVAVFVGSLNPEKRLDFLFDAADRLRAIYPQFQLLIAGDGPLRQVVRTYCSSRPWCTYVGIKTGREKALHLSVADVMLNPGLIGLGILDAFVAGLPIVTTDCRLHSPEIDYLKQDENGLMTPNTMEAFVTSIRRLLDNAEYRSSLSSGARMAGREYTIEHMAANFTDGIDMALDESTARCTEVAR